MRDRCKCVAQADGDIGIYSYLGFRYSFHSLRLAVPVRLSPVPDIFMPAPSRGRNPTRRITHANSRVLEPIASPAGVLHHSRDAVTRQHDQEKMRSFRLDPQNVFCTSRTPTFPHPRGKTLNGDGKERRRKKESQCYLRFSVSGTGKSSGERAAAHVRQQRSDFARRGRHRRGLDGSAGDPGGQQHQQRAQRHYAGARALRRAAFLQAEALHVEGLQALLVHVPGSPAQTL